MIKPNLKPVDKPNRLMSYIKREWAVLLLVAVTGLIFDGGMSLISVLQGKLIDTVAFSKPLSDVITAALAFLGVVLLLQVCRLLKRYTVRLFANRTTVSMRRMLYNSIISRDITAFDGISAGETMNRAVGDVDICVEGMRKVTTEIFDTGVLMTGYFIAMLTYDVPATLLACVFIPVSMFISSRLKAVIERATKLSRKQSGVISELTLSDVENCMLYRTNGVAALKCADYDAALEEMEKRATRANVYENSMLPVYKAISLIGIVAVIIFGGARAVNGEWSIGDFTAYSAIFASLTVKSASASKLFNSFQKAKVSWNRIQPDFLPYCPNDEKAKKPEPPCKLKCEAVSCTYPRADAPAFPPVSFEAKDGELVGVTGVVASGKTALGKALTGMYPYAGSITLGGRELSDFSSAERSAAVAYMGHDPHLFSDTIYNNITLGDGGDISAVLKVVCFDADLASMPEGINTMVGSGGVRLSGGQRARIALARALYRDSALLVLDDPFSAVDMETERKIIENLKALDKNRITVLISHRLAVFPDTDEVLFMERGKVTASDHTTLLRESEAYRTLWESGRGREDV